MSMKTICPVFLDTTDDFTKELEELEKGPCDLIEMRLDKLQNEKGKEAVIEAVEQLEKEEHPKKFIYTMRTLEEGGLASVDQKTYEEILDELYKTDDYVDVELSLLRKIKKELPMEKTVISYHNFEETPDIYELGDLWEEMHSYHPMVEKMSVMPNSDRDVQTLLTSCKNHSTDAIKIAISMSDRGKISRILGDLFGSTYTFCSLITQSAPGQPSLEEMAFYRSALDKAIK